MSMVYAALSALMEHNIFCLSVLPGGVIAVWKREQMLM